MEKALEDHGSVGSKCMERLVPPRVKLFKDSFSLSPNRVEPFSSLFSLKVVVLLVWVLFSSPSLSAFRVDVFPCRNLCFPFLFSPFLSDPFFVLENVGGLLHCCTN